jgi:tetratricopeptide (TPR) repeat protein
MDRTLSALLVLLLSCACTWGPESWLAANQANIDEATRAVEAARDDKELARSLTARGHAYGERARYSTTLKARSSEDCRRWFDLAREDHDRAVSLTPRDPKVYLERGLTYYFRAAVQDSSDPEVAAHYAAAIQDFTAVLERDAEHEQALDMRGLVHQATGDYDAAIADFTREMSIEPRIGRMRLADAFCNRASSHQRENRIEQAIADYEKSIELGASAGGCECQPHAPLSQLYRASGRRT